MNKVEGVIFDWAGTTVDFGCFAPVNAFINIFKDEGIEVTMEEARAPMGLLKIDHIRAMLDMPRISALWKEKFGRGYNEQDVEKLYANFEKGLMASLSEYTDPKPEVVETINTLRNNGLKIGSTSGYTQMMMDVVVPEAAKKGYSPDFYITPDDTDSLGRPYPYMIYRNMEKLTLSAAKNVIKVGDTIPDFGEANSAGVWAVGVVVGSSEMGLSSEEFDALSKEEQEAIIETTAQTFLQNGADFTINTMGELPQLIEKINILIAEGKRHNAK
ncbi:phosphonoacetaldehyde hydrolase [Oceanobacillus piezotolerans]|uniref:Phosphonoacetaldehyde hydrolase n=1 Tax=Oceanobacillus piezotolerans TaxID=2448030 RepID=A0A498D732_9BACI|nr:phosphonoacetaldehyde hydrolase [Oceanobacillus piezotolerans]RLL43824.1 phosphonoacetaldehyde hydrolase [Oceanobacillus piezotolerans]